MAGTKWDLRKLLVLSILTLGACMVVLLLLSGSIYRQLAYDNEERSLRRLIELKSTDTLLKLDVQVQEMGLHLQQREVVRSALVSGDKGVLQAALDGQFRQQLTTGGEVNLRSILAAGPDLAPLVQSQRGRAVAIDQQQFCSSSLDVARTRRGKERLRPVSHVCLIDGQMAMTVVVPIASFRVMGYLVLAVDPAPNMAGIEASLGAPVRVKRLDGSIVYQSESWYGAGQGAPTREDGLNHLVASYIVRASDEAPALSVSVQANMTEFNAALQRTSQWITLIAIIVGAPVFGVSLWVARGISGLIRSRDDEIVVRRDTERQLVEAKQEAEAANRSKSAFLSNMSHEIRTPLTAIIGFSESLLDSDQSMSDRIDAINTIVRSGKHLLGIINDILDVSKIEAKKLAIERTEVPLFPLLTDVFNIIYLHAEAKQIEFRIDHVFPLPEVIHTDGLRLKQILINLCGNAIKFTERGSVVVQVGYDAQSGQMAFEVQDSGIGISAEQQVRLFNPFAQAEDSTARRFGGTGLGLYLSRLLAQALGGDVTLVSELYRGSRFTARIDAGEVARERLVDKASEPTQSPREDSAAINEERYSGQILLAEDNADNQRLITLYLKRLGATVTYAENGAVAVARGRESTYELILMDMQMPVMNGLDATRELRASGYRGPIVALTANAMRSDIEACAAAGCDGFLSKPIDRVQFMNVVAQYLKRITERGTDVDQGPIYSTLLAAEPEMADLVEEYVRRAPQILAELLIAYERRDTPTLKRKVHDLKGVSGGYGFAQISALAAKIEFEIAKEDWSGIAALLGDLQRLMSRLATGEAAQASRKEPETERS